MADTIKTNLGPVTAYADAKAHGYTGTREEFGVLLANAGLNLKAAETAKEGAEAAKQAAETAQQAAAENQKNTETQAANAKASADTAAEQAAVAKESAADAANSATAAQESETNAGLSATAAANAEAAAKQAQNAAETAKADAETAKTAAGNSADAAANSAADAKKTLESIPADYSALSGKVDENTSGISELKGDLETESANSRKAIAELNDKKITKFYASNLGETTLNDSDNGNIQDMMLYGKSEQFSGKIELEDGTTVTVPCPDYPQEIKSVVNPVVTVTDSDGTNRMTATLPYTLNAIPVSSGGNVTIDGQEYIADYVDVERGKLVRCVGEVDLGTLGWQYSSPKRFYTSFLKGKILVQSVNSLSYVLCNSYKADTWSKVYGQTSDFAIGVVYDGMNKGYLSVLDSRYSNATEFRNSVSGINMLYALATQTEIDLTESELQAFRDLATHYPTTNVFVTSDQLDGYTEFNYPVSLAEGWNYVKQQLGDTRDYIYDMDLQSAEAYVNIEYAVTLAELEV